MPPLLYQVDATPLLVGHGTWPVQTGVHCTTDPQVLGIAMEIVSKKGGMTSWGHATLRIVACKDGAVTDVEYEAYRLGSWNEDQIRQQHAGEAFASGSYLKTQRGALVLFRNEHTVDAGWFTHLAQTNREIWELWLDLSPSRMQEVSDGAAAWYDQQLATFVDGANLPDRYVPWKRNCTEVWKRLLPESDPGSALPYVWLRSMEANAKMRVVHPSVFLASKLEPSWPAEIERQHILFRTHPTLVLDGIHETPVGPWTLTTR